MAGDAEASQLAEAAKLPWEERFKHAFWKARVAAYECVGKEAAAAKDITSSNCLKAFGECASDGRSPRPHLRRDDLHPASSHQPGHPLQNRVSKLKRQSRHHLRFVLLTLSPPTHVAGDCARAAAGDTNANALDSGLDALNAFLGVADEEYAARSAPVLPGSRRAAP
jgi:hypothetical protein